jgi:Undecaprenyl-phosphate galactose phosphotransferase WbaP
MMKQKYRGRIFLVSAIFVALDVFIIYAIFQMAFFVRQLLTPLLNTNALWVATEPLMRLGILFSVAAFYLQGLYPGYGLTSVKELERVGKSVSLAFFLLAGVSYLNKPFQDYSRSILLLGWLMALLVLPLSRFFMRNIISRFSLYGMPIVVFGDGALAQQIAATLKRVPRLGWYVTTIFPLKSIEHDFLKNMQGEIAIFAPSPKLPADKYARILSQNFRKVILIRQSDNLGSLWVEPRDLEGQLGLEFHYHLLEGHARWIKRLIDFGAGVILLVAFFPFLLILSLLIVFDSPGPIFFYQERIAQGLKRFKVIKFRTMMVDADKRLVELLQTDSAACAEYEKHHKLTNDPRITRMGKWLRRFSLDELPQLWNALKGDMSLVGPRAYMPSELDEMGEYAPTILRIKPGLTGWWQVMGRHGTTFQVRLKMDEYYISNWSLWMDIYILLKTVWVVIGGKGI